MSDAIGELAWLRPGFQEFNYYCNTNGIRLYFVTNGLEFYVEALLRKAGLRNIPSYSVAVEGQPRQLRYSYPYATEECWEWGNCKCKVLNQHRAKNSKIVYIGDGKSDLCASQKADFVFARSTLLRHCEQLQLPFQEFSNFFDVPAALKLGIPNIWQPSL